MPRFEAFSNGQHIGWSDLELGDPPMGVAFGVFVPAPGYSIIQEQVRAFAQLIRDNIEGASCHLDWTLSNGATHTKNSADICARRRHPMANI